jgi:hypothetical protein
VYAEGGELLGPDADPQGWKVFDPVNITGTLFNVRDVSVQCTVSGLFAHTYTSLSQEACAACHGHPGVCLLLLTASRLFH